MYNEFVWWTGTVEDIFDPEEMGRIKVRMYGIHTDNKTDIPTEALPWAQVITPITSASLAGVGHSPTGIVKGSWVIGFFKDGYEAQDPVVWGTTYGVTPKDNEVNCLGCSDESESDVNRLNREKTNDDIREYKEKARTTEPSSQSTTTYPDTTGTLSSRAGHHIETNDTPGQERVQRFHRSGSYQDYQPNGDVINRINGDHFEIIEDDMYIYVGKDYNITVEENLEISVSGEISEEIAETKDIFGGNTVTIDSDSKILLNP